MNPFLFLFGARTMLSQMSVRLSVCLSVTRRYSVETAKYVITLFSPSGSHTILVCPYQTVWQYSDGDSTSGGVECRVLRKNRDFGPIARFISEMIQHRAIVTMEGE